MNQINEDIIKHYIKKLHDRGESASLIERKLKAVDKFLNWAHQKSYIKDSLYKHLRKEIDKILNSNLKTQISKLELKTRKLEEKALNLRYKIKDLVSNLGIQYYIFFILLLVFIAALGAGIYNRFFLKPTRPLAYPVTLTRGGRILSFQGRLTDNLGNPITTQTDVVFKLYNVSSGGTALYTGSCTGVSGITPDLDGIFNVLIGSDCGMSEIPNSIFTENANVYLGVTVGADNEMTPRQPIANVGYAINAETLQGFPPGTETSTIPYINQQGDMLIAASSPGIRSINTSANFTLSSAKAVTLASAGDGDIVLQATESGALVFRTAGSTNTYTRIIVTNDGNVGIGTTSPNAKLNIAQTDAANDEVLILDTEETTSSQDVFKIISDVGGDETTVFNIDANGDITSGSWKGTAIGTQYGGTGQDWSAVAQGSVPYFSGTGSMATLAPGTAGYVLTTQGAGANPTWTEASGLGTNYWNLDFGVLYPKNSTVDLLIGGTATSSAKFAFLNVNSGTPTASVSGNLALAVPSGSNPSTSLNILNGGTFNLQTSVGGNDGLTSRLYVANSGNVGIGTTSPQAKLEVVGGNIYGEASYKIRIGYLTDATNEDYGIDPAGTSNFGGYSLKVTGGALLAVDSGNVGIGTTNPTKTLTISDEFTFDATSGQINVLGKNTSENTLNIQYDVLQTEADFAGISLDFSNITAGDGFNNYGIYLANFGASEGDPGLYGLYIAGTNWDYSIFTADDVYFGGDATVAGNDIIFGSGEKISNAPDGTIRFSNGINTLVDIIDQGTTGRLAISDSLQVGDLSTVAYSRFGPNTTDRPGTINSPSDVLISGDLELDGTLFVDSNQIANSSGTVTITLTNAPTTTASVLDNGSWSVSNTTNVGLAALLVDQQKAGDIFTASASGIPKFVIKNNGNVGIGTTTPAGELEVNGVAYANDFIFWDSYFAEEFSRERTSITSDTALGWGDDTKWSVDETYDGCTWDIIDDIINGISRQTANSSGFGSSRAECLTYLGGVLSGNAQTIFNTANKPIVLIKTRPQLPASPQYQQVWLGLSDSTLATNTDPTNGVWFTNDTNNDTNWYGQACAEGNCSTTSSCGAISETNFALLMIKVNSTTSVDFYIDTDVSNGVSMSFCGNLTTNIPTDNLSATIMNAGSGTSSRYLDVDFFRVWQDDSPITASDIKKDQSYDYQSGADLAENYPTIEGKEIEPGTLVSAVDGYPSLVQITQESYDPKIIGIVSTNPRGDLILGQGGEETVRVALSGRTETKVTSLNGPIKAGDPLTSSSIPGVAMKATKAGPIIGKALEDYDNSNQNAISKILVFVNPSWYDPDVYLTSTGDLKIVSDEDYIYDGDINQVENSKLQLKIQNYSSKLKIIKEKTSEVVERIVAASDGVIARVYSGFIKTQHIIIDNLLTAKNAVIENLSSLSSTIDNLTSRIINVREKITSPVVESEDLKTSGRAEINQIQTNEVRPQNKDLTINLEPPANPNSTDAVEKGALASLIIKGLEGKTVASIDAVGNATFSGTITASEATIAGTIAASQVTTNQLTSQQASFQEAQILNVKTQNLEGKEASLSGKLIAKEIESENINEIQRLLAEIKNQPLADPKYYQNIGNYQLPITNNQTDNNQQFNNVTMEQLTVMGNANFYTASVSDSLVVGSILFENNQILSLSWELKLSALSQINLFDGAVTIAKDGTMTTKGTLIAQGGVKTNEIKPINPNDNIAVVLNSKSERPNPKQLNSKLQILNSNNREVASIDASGSAYFKNLSLDKYLEATQSSAIIAAAENFTKNGIYAPAIETTTESAGLGILPAESNEIIIYNQNVKEDSLIYLTPVDQLSSTQFTIVKKESCISKISCKPYFKVATNSVADKDLKFNWLIIN